MESQNEVSFDDSIQEGQKDSQKRSRFEFKNEEMKSEQDEEDEEEESMSGDEEDCIIKQEDMIVSITQKA